MRTGVECDSSQSDRPSERPVRAPVTRKSYRVAPLCGLGPKEYRRLRRMRAPALFFQLLHFVTAMHLGFLTQDLDCIEWFAGCHRVVEACRSCGMSSLGFEIREDQQFQDLNKPCGMIEACILMLRLKAQGLCVWGTECSTWIFMSRSQYGRTRFCPLGRPIAQCAAEARRANQQVTRMALLTLLCWAKYGLFLLEQPLSSLMDRHPRLASFPFDRLYCSSAYMGSYGACSPKPSRLFSNVLYMCMQLETSLTHAEKQTIKAKNKDKEISKRVFKGGKWHTTGGKDLKQTGIYTEAFTKKVAESYSRWRTVHAPDLNSKLEESSESDYDGDVDDTWEDAELRPCLRLFKNSACASVQS